MLVEVDFTKRVGEIKERNQFYKTLLEVRQTAQDGLVNGDLISCQKRLQEIIDKCEQALEGVL